jgi:enoyl-CoA hydratase/carnithine racemase
MTCHRSLVRDRNLSLEETVGEFVNLEVSEDGVGTIRLDRPKVNALNAQVSREIGEAIDTAAADENVRAVVVWGGERVFAAGADIKEMADLDATRMFRYIGGFQDIFTRLERLPVVTIAAINGYALGGGCEMALACDLRVCAEDSMLGQPEILLGIIPGAGGTQRLPRIVGVARAKEIIYSGRFVPAQEALQIGLVNEVVASDVVYERALEIATSYARGPTVALLAAKQAIQTGIDLDMSSGLTVERQAFSTLFSTEDQKIGMESFAKEGPGKAQFVGR